MTAVAVQTAPIARKKIKSKIVETRHTGRLKSVIAGETECLKYVMLSKAEAFKRSPQRKLRR